MKEFFSNSLVRFLALLIICFATTFSNYSFGQENRNQESIDSLIKILISLEKSPEKSNVLLRISDLTVRDDYETALGYTQQALIMSEELEYELGIAKSSKQMAKIYTTHYLDYFEAKHHLSRALEVAEGLSDEKLLMNIYSDYGFLMNSMGDCENATRYNLKAIKIAEEGKMYNQLAALYGYIAEVYLECGEKKNAVEYFSMAYTLYSSDKLSSIAPAVRLAAAQYKSLTGDKDGAIAIYKEAIGVFNKSDNIRFASYTYAQLAKMELNTGDYYSALDHVNTGLEIAVSNNLIKEKLDNYEVQVSVYDSLGDYKKTYIALIKATRLRDSLSTSQFQEQNRKFQTNYEEMVDKSNLDKLKEQQINHELEIENQRLNRNAIIGVLVFVFILGLLMILRLRYIRKKEREMNVLSLATSHSTNSIIIFDADLRVDWVNKGFERLTGLSLAEVKGQFYLDFYYGPNLDSTPAKKLKENFNSGKTFSMELERFHVDSDEGHWISINVTPLFEGDKVSGYVSVATDITAIHGAQEQLQKSHDQTILLNEIGRQITSTLSVSEIIEKVYENVNKLMDAQNLGIGIFREEDNGLFFPEPIEKGNKLSNFVYSVEDKERLAVKCFLDNQEICVGTIDEIIEVTGANVAPIAGGSPESVVYMPLISKWKTIGVISVQSFEQNAYGQKELDMVRSLATYVAIALENAGLYENMEESVAQRTKEVTAQKEQLERNYENLKLLSEIGVEISSSVNFDDVFETLYETVAKMMDAEIFGVRLYHEELNEIEYKYEIESGERDPVMSISMDDKDNYSVWCIENKKEILLKDNLNEHTKYVKEIKVPSGEMPNSLIFYPMLADGRVFGVITVQSFKKNAYTPYHVAIVKTLSSYSAAALSNSELYDTLEHKVEERTKELAQKNKDIMASINYARRIQHGILPTKQFMNQLLPENFVFYRPRDIISGDFYWVERNRDKVFFAVVDCTGHGVPGALMSIIGKNILDQAVNEKEVVDPSMILTFLRAGLRVAFSADEGIDGADVEDGMDLGVCVWDIKDMTVTFSGANSNMYLIHDGALEVVKGEKAGVSASDFDMKNYNSHEVEILPGDTIYLSSDGYPDQFGGERMKKYSQRRFQELLLRLSSLPLDTQEDELDKEFLEWKGEYNQLDDICVMGIRF